jgi:hypothetical protein
MLKDMACVYLFAISHIHVYVLKLFLFGILVVIVEFFMAECHDIYFGGFFPRDSVNITYPLLVACRLFTRDILFKDLGTDPHIFELILFSQRSEYSPNVSQV